MSSRIRLKARARQGGPFVGRVTTPACNRMISYTRLICLKRASVLVSGFRKTGGEQSC